MPEVLETASTEILEPDVFTDGRLLSDFVERRSESAFNELVHRHGSMVMNVCRGVIGNTHDAEDAFQATFLVLMRKAAALRSYRSISGWLYEVAYRTSLKARSITKRRIRWEVTLTDDVESPQSDTEAWVAMRPIIDEELARLPEFYRIPLVMCCLEGYSYRDAAAQLGWPEGTFSVRLSRAKSKFAEYLRRRGLLITASSLGAVFAARNAIAENPSTTLVRTTLKSALATVARQPIGQFHSSSTAVELSRSIVNSMTRALFAKNVSMVALEGLGLLFVFACCSTIIAVVIWSVLEDGTKELIRQRPLQGTTNPKVGNRNTPALPSNKNSSAATERNQLNAVNSQSRDKTWTVKGSVVADRMILLPPLVRKNDPVKPGVLLPAEGVPNETLVIDPKTLGVKNVLIWIRNPPALPPKFGTDPISLELTAESFRFEPHIQIAYVSHSVRLRNFDPVQHSFHLYPVKNQGVNCVLEPRDGVGVTPEPFALQERLPFVVKSDIYPWMSSYIFVINHPFSAVTDENGEFEMPNVPAGEHVFVVWHELVGYVNKSLKINVDSEDSAKLKVDFDMSRLKIKP